MTKTHRSDANIIANLAEDLDGAQAMLEAGHHLEARSYVEASVKLLKERLPRAEVKLQYALGKCHCTVVLDGNSHHIKSVSRVQEVGVAR